jgi:hypothetical protein
MSFLLVVFASHWGGSRVPCRFQAWADKKPLSPTGVSTDSAPVYEISSATVEVTLKATPTDSPSPYWENTVFLTVGANSLSAKQGSEGFVVLSKSTTLGDPSATFAKIVLSQFKDYTEETVKLLVNPPTTRLGKTPDVSELTSHQNLWGPTWPPSDWGLDDLTGAHFIDVTKPVTSGGALNFAKSALEINVDSVVLRLAGVDAPQLFAVTWPDAKELKPAPGAKPTPFLVFIEQSLQGNQYDLDGMFVGGEFAAPDKAYPNNFDYADMLFQQLHYAGTPPSIPETPFFWEGAKGVPYQVAKAGVNVVTVIPLNSFEKDFGVMKDMKQTGIILEELRAFMFMRAGVSAKEGSVGNTAMASFSSGNIILGSWIAPESNRNSDFMQNKVKALYFLDPALDPKHPPDVNTFIPSALEWAKSGADKAVRLYMRYPTVAHKKLLEKTSPAVPYVANSSVARRTAAVLPTEIWIAALTKIFGAPDPDPKKFVAWSFAHHMFAATMLTHALWQKDL